MPFSCSCGKTFLQSEWAALLFNISSWGFHASARCVHLQSSERETCHHYVASLYRHRELGYGRSVLSKEIVLLDH